MAVADDFAAMGELFAEAFAVDVVYVRGGNRLEIVAAPVVNDYEVDNGFGGVETIQVRDYVLAVADLTIDAAPIDPRSGDRIEEPIGGNTHNYEVVPVANRPVDDYYNPEQTQWLVHTNHIGTV
jgi:hypothetical protein